MTSHFVERLENLIRVVSKIPDERFDILRWYNHTSKCGCAIGHAIRDEYFIAQNFNPNMVTSYKEIGAFFDISEQRAKALFVYQVGYGSRLDVLSALRVLLIEKKSVVPYFPVRVAVTEPELEIV